MTSSSTITSIAPSCARLASSATPESTRRPVWRQWAAASSASSMPAHVVDALGLLQEEAVGAADVEQASGRLEPADEIDGAGKLPPQDRLGAEIVGIAVGVPAGEIIRRVVAFRVEAAGRRRGRARTACSAGCGSRSWRRGTAAAVARAAGRAEQRPLAIGATALPSARGAGANGGRRSRQRRAPARCVRCGFMRSTMTCSGRDSPIPARRRLALITFAHLSVSLATILPKSAGVPRDRRCRRVRRAAP